MGKIQWARSCLVLRFRIYYIKCIIDRYNQIEVNIKNGKNFTISREIFLYTLSHIKNYEGQLIAHHFNKYRFYDEREFRSVPLYKELKKLHPTIPVSYTHLFQIQGRDYTRLFYDQVQPRCYPR